MGQSNMTRCVMTGLSLGVGMVWIALAVVVAAPGRPPTLARFGEPARIELAATSDTWVGLSAAAVGGARTPGDGEAPHGSEPVLFSGRADEQRGWSIVFVDFDLASVPRDAWVDSAALELYAERASGGPLPVPLPAIRACAVTDTWSEATLDAANAPAIEADAPCAVAYAPRGAWARWDATAAVRERIRTGKGTGFWLQTDVSYFVTGFSSRESDRAPRLVVEVVPGAKHAPLCLPVALRAGDLRRTATATPPRTPGVPTPTPRAMTDPPLPPAQPDDRPWLALTRDRATVDFGAVPRFEVGWEDHAGVTTTLVMPVDGSSEGWRMPMYVWQVRRTDGAPVRERSRARRGTTNPLFAEDFLDLGPGARKPLPILYEGAGGSWFEPPNYYASVVVPGTYEVRVVYEFEKAGGITPREIVDRWVAAREMVAVSPWVTFTVGSPVGRYATRLDAARRIAVGVSMTQVQRSIGPPDQTNRDEYRPIRYRTYYLADPRPGEPEQLGFPQFDEDYREYWRPRFVLTVDYRDQVLQTAILP
jgi:hypothetical protein